MLQFLMPAVRASLVLWALLGLAYPFAVTGLGQAIFPYQAQGSLIRGINGAVIGSRLIGQRWTGLEWFHGRPSATSGADPSDPTKSVAAPYNPANSGGSNLGPTSRTLVDRLTADRKALDQIEPALTDRPIPADALTASASGLDPEISPAYAALQVPRVSAARGVTADEIVAVLNRHITGRTFGIFGEPRVNVLELNVDLQDAHRAALWGR